MGSITDIWYRFYSQLVKEGYSNKLMDSFDLYIDRYLEELRRKDEQSFSLQITVDKLEERIRKLEEYRKREPHTHEHTWELLDEFVERKGDRERIIYTKYVCICGATKLIRQRPELETIED